MRGKLSRVIKTTLYPITSDGIWLPEVEVGTAPWYEWLAIPQTRSFTYRSPYGTATFRKENRKLKAFWYAYRFHRGKALKVYAGSSKQLDGLRLQNAAESLMKRLPDNEQPRLERQPGQPYFPDLSAVEYIDGELFVLAGRLREKGTLTPSQVQRLMEIAQALAFDLAVAQRTAQS